MIDAARRRFAASVAALGTALALPATPSRAIAADRGDSVAFTRSGPVRGTRSDGVHVFRGIPYGADTATRRFMPALREQPWDRIRNATTFAASAPQAGTTDACSEDCLFVNVWTPGLRDGARRPVLVYIHGGGYDTGSGSDALYDGARLCTRGDVMVVTLNHRLNAFGYLYLRELGGADFADSGNVGQLDLVQALRWVREHAAAFGGDAGNVTLFGQSGGGAKIATLMAMPAAAGLFHRAWTISGQQVTAAGPRVATQRAALLLDTLKIQPSQLDRLRTLPAAAMVAATQATRDPSLAERTRLYFGPVMDMRVLPRHPFWPDAPAQSATIPMVIGNTRDETRAFLGRDDANFAMTWDALPARLQQEQFVDLDPDFVVAEYRRLYPHDSPSDVFFAATTAGRSWRGAIEELEARARAGQGASTWAYQLDFPSPVDGGRFRAMHTLDIPLVFDNIAKPGSMTGTRSAAQAVADAMSAALLAFARNGRPSAPGLPTWAPYSLARRETMLFDATSRMQDDPRAGERLLFARVPFVQRGTL